MTDRQADASTEDMLLAYDEELPLADSFEQLARIDSLVGVSERFKSDVRSLALRMMSFQDRWRCFRQIAQLSQLGTGLGGGRQSPRDEHVRLDFFTGAGGEHVAVFVDGNKLEFRARDGISGTASFKASYSSQDGLRAVVDFFCTQRWTGNI